MEKKGKGLLVTNGKSLTLDNIKGLARVEHGKSPLGLIIIDYDQKIELSTTRDIQEWKALQIAVASLEELAKELGIYILLFAQESSEEGRISGSFRSTFSAATVMRFFRHKDGNDYILADLKNRFGPIGEGVRVKYSPDTSLVKEVEQVNAKQIKEASCL